MTGRTFNRDTQRTGAVRKWSEGGIPCTHARSLIRTSTRKHSSSLTPYSHHHLDICLTSKHLRSLARTHAFSHAMETIMKPNTLAYRTLGASVVAPPKRAKGFIHHNTIQAKTKATTDELKDASGWQQVSSSEDQQGTARSLAVIQS